MLKSILTFVAGLMFIASVFWILGNWWAVIRGVIRKPKGSGLPIIPGVLGAVALLIAPPQNDIFRWHSYWWVPLLVDVGCVPWLIYHICFALKKRRNNSSTKERS